MAAAVAFDPSSAQPVEADSTGFDPSSAQPVDATPDVSPDPRAGMTHAAPPAPKQAVAAMLYPEVDFDSGLPFLDRTHLSQADNFEEKKAYLQKVYGKKNVEVQPDPAGDPMLIVTKDGKKIAAEGGGQFASDMVGSAPILASMGVGAAEGAALGALGGPLDPITIPAGAVGGAAIGGMFGKTVTEAEKAREGIYRKTPGQYASSVNASGEAGALGEMGGSMLTKGASRLMRGPLPELISQADPQNRAMTERTLAGGARPPAASTVPGAKKIQWTEALARKTVSSVRSQDTANADYVANRMRDILRDSGVPEKELDPTLRELEAGEAKVPTEEIGEHVKTRVQAHTEMLEKQVEGRLKETNEQIDKQIKHLDTLTQRFNPGDLGVDVASGIRQARKDFGTAMSKVYEKVDSLVGDQKLVDTSLPAKEATRLGKQLPRTGQQALQRETAALGQPQGAQEDLKLYDSLGLDPPPSGKVSFGDAQRFRTALREKADELNLTRDSRAHAAARLADMWDYAIQGAAKDPVAAPAVKLLNAADKQYSIGIKRFQDATVKRLVKNLEAGLPPDPEEVARQVVQPGQEARVKEIRKLVGEDTWKRVAGADYSRMVRASTDETGGVDGTRLLAEIRQRRQLMPVVYGDKLSQQIEELARTVAVRDGTLPPDALAPGKIRQTLENLRAAEESQNRFLKENYLGLLGNPRRNPEQVYRWLVKPDNVAALRQAVQLFGEDSPQIKGVQQGALKELLSTAKMNFADGREAEALSAALSKYTPEQQKLLFPKGMDSDLNLLGKEIEFVMRSHSDESKASFAAGAVMGLPLPARIPIQIGIGMYQVILSQPSVIRYLALGLRQPPGAARIAARRMVENLVRFGALAPTLNSDQGAPTNGEKGDTTLSGATAGP